MPSLKGGKPIAQKRKQNETSNTLKNQIPVFLALFTFRLVNTYFVQTSFQPDEYFQSLEPAWDIAFGPESGAWLTWEWRSHLRTSVHPYLFASTYSLVNKLSNLLASTPHSRAAALLAAPRILQAFWAAWMDLCTWKLAQKLYSGPEVRRAALALTVGSPWQWFCSTRTFSNSLEATLTVGALVLFPWRFFLEGNSKTTPEGLWLALTAAAAAFYFRPTNIIIWIAISAGLVWCSRSLSKALTLLQAAAVVGTSVIVLFAGIDRVYYAEWAFPPLKFLYINLFQSLAVFYGRNRVDYYFTEGLPLLLTTALPFAAVGFWNTLRRQNGDDWREQTRYILAAAALATVFALSTIDHKEMRFIYPLLPSLHILAARPLAAFPTTTPRKLLLYVAVAANIYIAYYTTIVHQRGVIDVMHYLRNTQEARFEVPGAGNLSVGFLMPCHSTPWRSHFVYPEIEAWALTCEPPLNLSMAERETYLDEADVFYADPESWLKRNMGENGRAWPEYLVFFEHLEDTMKDFMLKEDKGYKECKRLFNTQWHDDGRRMGDVIVHCRG